MTVIFVFRIRAISFKKSSYPFNCYSLDVIKESHAQDLDVDQLPNMYTNNTIQGKRKWIKGQLLIIRRCLKI